MRKNKYLLLISSLGSLALLIVAAVEEQRTEWRHIQRGARLEGEPIPIRLRQVVNPTLGAADRCVSCHVAMNGGEQGVVGSKPLVPHPRVPHDPSEFGCTVCHGGQGRATTRADAHGEAPFWPEPMLPRKFSYAGCGACHVGSKVPHAELLARATAAFERLDCLACHRVDGRGGTIRPNGTGMEGPDLSAAGIRGYDRDWYRKHVEKSLRETTGPWRTSFSSIPSEDLHLLELYLDTRIGASLWMEAKATFLSRGCLGCHKVSGVGGDEGPDLTRAGLRDPGQTPFSGVPGARTLANWFSEHLRSPAAVVTGSQMPPVISSEREIELLTFYTLSLRRKDLPSVFLPRDRTRVEKLGEREFSTDGATLFRAFCSGCHGTDGLGLRTLGIQYFPSIAHPDLLRWVSDEFLLETIRRGRPGRKMPAWGEIQGGLRPEEIREVAAYLRKLGKTPQAPDTRPARWVKGDVESGRRLFAAACAGCHGANGEGGEGPALRNPVLLATATDTFLVETISRGRRGTSMEGFLTPSPARRTLSASEVEDIVSYLRSWEGAKP